MLDNNVKMKIFMQVLFVNIENISTEFIKINLLEILFYFLSKITCIVFLKGVNQGYQIVSYGRNSDFQNILKLPLIGTTDSRSFITIYIPGEANLCNTPVCRRFFIVNHYHLYHWYLVSPKAGTKQWYAGNSGGLITVFNIKQVNYVLRYII